ncbi:hypothetical protein POX_e07238 [Penicillium oxalicum]|uniref:Mitotic checkpoint regulator, MAD2B-interacting-domain-containing protein n=1 Tax=Penicillium oxalicum (strain 114-2 / CGMCC 5302) TaxID=933388 RepID=S7ZHU7_PENO1|nr:hypothetical protein POX_e07238 [Penicillium oxalicum]EPS28266.1 hypothetical protein PDE_03212 [Penicillium oxalicum 114-2]KAI2789208.1 hypothetical protein POX_e07238 [Penicillium oxalicum]
MALVAYSDSETSDVELDTTPAAPAEKPKKSDTVPDFHVDRGNPRKIRVALPDLKPEPTATDAGEEGPARKRTKLGGGGGGSAFSGFNSFLPAPKRLAEKKASTPSTRKIFSLKTGAEPGFDRTADAEMRNTLAQESNPGPTSNEAPSLTEPKPQPQKTEAGEIKLQGNPMMFRPLSVARNQKKKKPSVAMTASASTPPTSTTTTISNPVDRTVETSTQVAPAAAPASAPPKQPKVSLFSLSSSEDRAATETIPAISTTTGNYEPLVYTTETEHEISSTSYSEDPALASDVRPTESTYYPSNASVSSSLDTIANDLNLSKAERRQLFGRNAPSADSRILTFNTDKEYASNQAISEAELAATQHNPVRAIAPGKHTLQQLVNAASSQKDALEESFATGRRNKKEAGSKYGW